MFFILGQRWGPPITCIAIGTVNVPFSCKCPRCQGRYAHPPSYGDL